ncbi:hypothetical protein JCM11641_006145 [Rhodosporidiobolus odoratus]
MRNPAAQPKLCITCPGYDFIRPIAPATPDAKKDDSLTKDLDVLGWLADALADVIPARAQSNGTFKREFVPSCATGLICLDTDETLFGFEATRGLLRQNALDEAAYLLDQDFTNESPSIVAVWENYFREVEHLPRAFFDEGSVYRAQGIEEALSTPIA